MNLQGGAESSDTAAETHSMPVTFEQTQPFHQDHLAHSFYETARPPTRAVEMADGGTEVEATVTEAVAVQTSTMLL